MSLRVTTIAIMIGLSYEILFKIVHLLVPSFVRIPIVTWITTLLSIVVGIIIFLFLLALYQEEKSHRNVKTVLILLLSCFILRFLIRLPWLREAFDYLVIRMSGEVLSFFQAGLLLVFAILFRKIIPDERQAMKRATEYVIIMFSFGLLASVYSLITYARFFIAGTVVTFSPLFLNMMFVLFLLTHGSMIYFLYRYYQIHSPSESNFNDIENSI